VFFVPQRAYFCSADIRVGRIVEAKKHPDADGLYVEKIDIGDATGPRTVVSGLAKYIPLDQLEGKLVLCLANIKPTKLRGITSEAMVLAASDAGRTRVELIEPPEESVAGDHVTFDGFEWSPDVTLNPKHKVWEKCQSLLKTSFNGTAMFQDAAFRTASGVCSAPTVFGGIIS
jgi:methionine--tRNA ligase beta chain